MKDMLRSSKDLEKEKSQPPEEEEKPKPPPEKEGFEGFRGIDRLRELLRETTAEKEKRPLPPEAPVGPKEPPAAVEPEAAKLVPSPPLKPSVYAKPVPPVGEEEKVEKPAEAEPIPKGPSEIPVEEVPPPLVKEVYKPTEGVSIRAEESMFGGGPLDTLYEAAHAEIKDVLKKAERGEDFTIDGIFKMVRQFVASLQEEDTLFTKAIHKQRIDEFLPSKSVNVSIISIKAGTGFHYSDAQLLELGLAGFLYNVGMTRVPKEVLNKKGRLTPEEFGFIKRHPIDGRDILERFKNTYLFLPLVAYQVREKEDGSGYPEGIPGEEIHEYAKIIGLADFFEALVHARSYRDGLAAYRAMQKIIEGRNKEYSSRVIKAFVDVVTLFPIGSLVKLNSGEIARVVTINPVRPLRPVVEIFINSRGGRISKPRRLDLEMEPLIYISKPILEEDEY